MFSDPFGLYCVFIPNGFGKPTILDTRTVPGPITSRTIWFPTWTGTPGAPGLFWTTEYTKNDTIQNLVSYRTTGVFVCYEWRDEGCGTGTWKQTGDKVDTFRDSDPKWVDGGSSPYSWFDHGTRNGTDWGPDELPDLNGGAPPPVVIPPKLCPVPGGFVPC